MPGAGNHSNRLQPFVWVLLGTLAGYFGHGLLERNDSARKEQRSWHSPTPSVAGDTAAMGSPRAKSAFAQASHARLDHLTADPSNLNIQAILAEIQNLTLAECKPAYQLLARIPGDDRNVVFRALSRHWCGLDPVQAMESAQGLRDMNYQRILVREAARELVRRDPDAVLEFISNSRNPLFKVLNAHAILPVLTGVDPRRATAYLSNHPEFLRYEDVYREVAQAYARLSPAEALAWAQSIPSAQLRAEASKHAWVAWAENDPATAATALGGSNGARIDGDVYGAVSRSWSARDPIAARDWVESLHDKEGQAQAWANFQPRLDQLGPEDAMKLIQSISSEKGRVSVASWVASQMGQQDLAAALAWAERLPAGQTRSQAIRPLLDEWSMSDPAAAVAYAAACPADAARSELLRRTVASWSMHDPEAALAWTQAMPAGHERDEAASEAVQALQRFDPLKTLPWLNLIEDSGIRNNSAAEIAGEWGQIDGAAAARWASQLPAEAQIQAFHSITRGWGFADREAAANWVHTLPQGAARDSAIEAYVSVIDGYDAGLATRWATAIEQPEQRDRTVSYVFRRWLGENPGSAQDWLASAQLSDQLRLQLDQSVAEARNQKRD